MRQKETLVQGDRGNSCLNLPRTTVLVLALKVPHSRKILCFRQRRMFIYPRDKGRAEGWSKDDLR